jgi:hypothetical protein
MARAPPRGSGQPHPSARLIGRPPSAYGLPRGISGTGEMGFEACGPCKCLHRPRYEVVRPAAAVVSRAATCRQQGIARDRSRSRVGPGRAYEKTRSQPLAYDRVPGLSTRNRPYHSGQSAAPTFCTGRIPYPTVRHCLTPRRAREEMSAQDGWFVSELSTPMTCCTSVKLN